MEYFGTEVTQVDFAVVYWVDEVTAKEGNVVGAYFVAVPFDSGC